MGRNSFVLYTDYYEHISKLSNTQRGILLTAIYSFVMGDELPEMDPVTDMAFGFIRDNLARDGEKWEKTVERRKEAAKKAADARWMRTDANACERIPNACVNVNANDNVNDNVSVNVPTAGAVLGTKMVRSKNRFSNYEQNKYDLESLERILTNE